MVAEALTMYVRRPDLMMISGIVLFMVYSQYQRAATMERRLFGFVKNPPWPQLGRALVHGILGGMLATAVFVLLGISLSAVGIWYLWLLAIALMFIHPRFLCFSYGGGLLALSSILVGWPRIDVPALMALIAVLHMVEAVLIYASGGDGATPMFVREADGRVVGGFVIQKFWPVPFVALVGALVAPEVIQSTPAVSMPQWWPIIAPMDSHAVGMEYAYALFPVVAALGYSDVSVTALPRQKARRTAWNLMAYSIGLLLLAIAAQWGTPFALAAAVFSPVAHEWVIRRSRHIEEKGKSVFTGEATMVLDVHPYSPAARAGLQTGDVIRTVNGIPVHSREALAQAMEPWSFHTVFEVENVFTGEKRTLTCTEKLPPLGVVLVPHERMRAHMELRSRSRMMQVLGRLGRKLSLPKGP